VNPLYLVRKKCEGWLHWLLPTRVMPLYNMVSFSTVRYSEARQRWKRQGFWFGVVSLTAGMGTLVGTVWLGLRYGRDARGAIEKVYEAIARKAIG